MKITFKQAAASGYSNLVDLMGEIGVNSLTIIPSPNYPDRGRIKELPSFGFNLF